MKSALFAALGFAMLLEVSCVIFEKWTFDDVNGTMVVPSVHTESNFYADVSPLGTDMNKILPEGASGRAVYVNGNSFNLATNLGPTCVRDPDVCVSGFILGFRLKLVSWNEAANPVIFRTTAADKSNAGVYLGKHPFSDDILFYVRGSSGKTYSTFFAKNYVWNQWALITISWYKTEKNMLISRNGPVFVAVTSQGNAEETPHTPANFVVGDQGGPIFYLDDLVISYEGDTISSTSAITSSTTRSTSTPVTTPTTTRSTTVSTSIATTTSPSTTSTSAPETKTQTIPISTSTPAPTTRRASTVGLKNTTPDDGNAEILSNIWIPILIAVLAILLFGICFIWLLCRHRRKKRGSEDIARPDSIPLANTNKGYARASTIEAYQDDGSNVETDDDHTDQEDNSRRLV